MDHNDEVFLGDPMISDNSSIVGGKGSGGVHLATLTDPLAGESFILTMAAAATRHGTSIMPCMSNPNVLLYSVMAPAITHGRASPDSHPNNKNYVGFGGAAAWQWAIGIWPFKDVFYTNTTSGSGAANVPNAGADKGMREDQPWTHTLVAALSGGGVAPGDVVGGSDTALIMQTCRADGTLLKPASPATYIDRTWESLFRLPDAGGSGAGVTGLGETSSADAVVSGGLLYKIFYVLPPTQRSTIESVDVGLSSTGSHVVYQQVKYGGVISSVAKFGAGADAVNIHAVQCQGGEGCDKTQLFIAAPILSNGWAILGETTKIVAVSAQRIVSVVASSGTGTDTAAVKLELIGVAGERVEMAFMKPDGSIISTTCTVGMSGRVQMLAGIPMGAEACQHVGLVMKHDDASC